MSMTHLTAGFLPLLDSVLLVLAQEKGFAAKEGLDLHLVRETSWANIRDRAAIARPTCSARLQRCRLAETGEPCGSRVRSACAGRFRPPRPCGRSRPAVANRHYILFAAAAPARCARLKRRGIKPVRCRFTRGRSTSRPATTCSSRFAPGTSATDSR